MNRAFSLILSIILHFFILKAWVLIIDSGSIPKSYRIDTTNTTLNLNSFSDLEKKSNIKTSSKSGNVSKSNNEKLVEDIGPLLSEKDLKIDRYITHKVQTFRINGQVNNETFQIKNEKTIDDPVMSKTISTINSPKKNNSKVLRRYNIDEGIDNSKIEYIKENEGALVEASSKLENAFWIKKPEFSYPRLAEKEGIEGIVKLKVTINTSGTITKAIISEKTNSILDEAALRDIYKGKIGAINNRSKNRINAEVIVTIPYRFGK